MRVAAKHANPRAPSRRDVLDDAGRALGKGQLRKALERYVGLLERDASDPGTHLKAADLYIRLKQPARAREHFAVAARIYMNQGFETKALAVYRTAVGALPEELEFWEALGTWHRDHGYPAEAIKTFLEARRHFGRRRQRLQAVRLLEAVFAIEPWHCDATMDLAALLRRTGQRARARQYYEGLAERTQGGRLRRVRGALFRMSPTPAAAWRWLRAALLGR